MKKLKEFFKMMITAIICLAMSLIPGKRNGQAVKVLTTGGQAFGGNRNRNSFNGTKAEMPGKIEYVPSRSNKIITDMQRFKYSTLQKYVTVPTVGPGDIRMNQCFLSN